MMKRVAGLSAVSLLCLIMLCPAGLSQQRHGKRKLRQSQPNMRREIEALKKGQRQILAELRELRRLLATGEAATADAPPAAPPQPAGDLIVNFHGDPARGAKAARVAIVEYSDFQCPFCGTYARETYSLIEENYIKTGKVKYFFRDLPLPMHPNAFPAAQAARCAGDQGKFWEMHDRLFANQNALSALDLFKHAQALALDTAQFNQCLMSGKYTNAIRRSVSEAEGYGINGTPAFMIGVIGPNGEQLTIKKVIVGAEPYESFKAALDELLSTGKK
jgi:protein-disulfide isomerase